LKRGNGFSETEDLKNIMPREANTFMVTAAVEHQGEKVVFEGSETIKVLE
jgi:hypothetical protein